MSDQENESHLTNELHNKSDEIEKGRSTSQNDRDRSHSTSNRSNYSTTNKPSRLADDNEKSPKRRGTDYDSSSSESDQEHFKRKAKPIKRVESFSERTSTCLTLMRETQVKKSKTHVKKLLKSISQLSSMMRPCLECLKIWICQNQTLFKSLSSTMDSSIYLTVKVLNMVKNDTNMANITTWKEMDTSNRDYLYQSMSMPEMCRPFERMIIALGQVNMTIGFQ